MQFMMSICSGLYLIVIVLRDERPQTNTYSTGHDQSESKIREITEKMTGSECLILSQWWLIINSGLLS